MNAKELDKPNQNRSNKNQFVTFQSSMTDIRKFSSMYRSFSMSHSAIINRVTLKRKAYYFNIFKFYVVHRNRSFDCYMPLISHFGKGYCRAVTPRYSELKNKRKPSLRKWNQRLLIHSAQRIIEMPLLIFILVKPWLSFLLNPFKVRTVMLK